MHEAMGSNPIRSAPPKGRSISLRWVSDNNRRDALALFWSTAIAWTPVGLLTNTQACVTAAYMQSIRRKHTTRTLGAPQQWCTAEDGVCTQLPVSDGDGYMCSYWRPSLMERLRIVFGGHVRLSVFGNGHPPVWIDTVQD